jgi:dihydropteroate synthase
MLMRVMWSDGGKVRGVQDAVDRALHMATQGATIIDVGGESTR